MSAAALPSGDVARIIFRPHLGQFESAVTKGVASLKGALQSSGMAVSIVRARACRMHRSAPAPSALLFQRAVIGQRD
jgi:hypothetical protein